MINFPDNPALNQTCVAPNGTQWRWNGSVWVMVASASGGGSLTGQVAYAEVTAPQWGIGGALVDLGGLAVSFRAVAGRRYRFSASVFGVPTTAPAGLGLYLVNSAGTMVQLAQWQLQYSTAAINGHLFWTWTAATGGVVSYKLQMMRFVGTDTIGLYAEPGLPSFLLVEDITPAIVGSGGISGFTFVSDTMPPAGKSGDTWFNSSAATNGGVSYVAIDKGNGDLTWVQFSPGSGSTLTTAWTPVVFQNGWVNYGGSFQTVQYRMLGDVVHLRGVMKNGTLGAVAFTLPSGFRPPADLSFLQEAGGAAAGAGAISVNGFGTITPQSAFGANGSYFYMNIHFSVTA